MNVNIAVVAVSLLALSGCNMNPSLYTANASKSEGTVTMAYHYTSSTPVWWSPKFGEEAQQRASVICQGWAFDSARPLDDSAYRENGGAIEGIDSVIYQCIKDKE
ncbi:hypothetical protein [Citrobacter sp. Marseille-Q6884]|uniref:hypothetical protein n=1 Tax=Citrobacter sp. Marseille-Q6884 TaxID=2956786 RepID=UPI0021B20ED6|nr:hypothetical protein [Citrobacter sp. Marseille-Q6884]